MPKQGQKQQNCFLKPTLMNLHFEKILCASNTFLTNVHFWFLHFLLLQAALKWDNSFQKKILAWRTSTKKESLTNSQQSGLKLLGEKQDCVIPATQLGSSEHGDGKDQLCHQPWCSPDKQTFHGTFNIMPRAHPLWWLTKMLVTFFTWCWLLTALQCTGCKHAPHCWLCPPWLDCACHKSSHRTLRKGTTISRDQLVGVNKIEEKEFHHWEESGSSGRHTVLSSWEQVQKEEPWENLGTQVLWIQESHFVGPCFEHDNTQQTLF